jgi:MoxR-like ATPase
VPESNSVNAEPYSNEDVFPVYGGPNPGTNHKRIPAPPPWRVFTGGPLIEREPGKLSAQDLRRATTFQSSEDLRLTVSAAIALRRPILITGNPGTGKSTLAYAIAYDLGLGSVLRWNITSRTSLKDGLYTYDALDRLNEASLLKEKETPPSVGRFIKLGPLGTALLPTQLPRVLLIDELDKSDFDFTNDLLNIFEEGTFEIPELRRAKEQSVGVLPYDAKPGENPEIATAEDVDRVVVNHGSVTCNAFPIVVLTSNAERQFSPAFLRRCIQYQFETPGYEALSAIAKAHIGEIDDYTLAEILEAFVDKSQEGLLATDQLLNALFLLSPDQPAGRLQDSARIKLRDIVLTELSSQGLQ